MTDADPAAAALPACAAALAMPPPQDARHDALFAAVQRSGLAWIGAGRLSKRRCLRACISNFTTTAGDIDATAALIASLAAPLRH